MRSSVGLCVLALMSLHSSVFGQDAVADENGFLVFCDDPSVVKAVHSALHKFNEGLSAGHKLALFQILRGSKSENGSHSVYSLQFSARRADCPATNLLAKKKPILCNATALMSETDENITQVDCMLDEYIAPERASCLGCPKEIDVNSEDLKSPVAVAVSKYNSISDSPHLFALHSIGYATRQVVAGFRFKLSFDMRKTTCAKAEHSDLNDLCVPDEEKMEFAHCNSTVDVAPWRLEPPQAHVECEPGLLPVVFTKRRPAGWSPLRNFLMEVPPTTSPPPTPVLTKEESSEEDSTASKPSVSPAVNDRPFHCPSEPWKPINPEPAAPTEAAPEASTGGGFTDTDLLA